MGLVLLLLFLSLPQTVEYLLLFTVSRDSAARTA